MTIMTKRIALRMACARAGVTIEDATGRVFDTETNFRRMHVIAILRAEHRYSYPVIGRLLNRSHSAIVKALQKYPVSVYTWHHTAEYSRPIASVQRFYIAHRRAVREGRVAA